MERIRALKDKLDHHADDEESDQFPKLRTHITANDRVDMGAKIEKAKKLAPTRPHLPAHPLRPPKQRTTRPAACNFGLPTQTAPENCPLSRRLPVHQANVFGCFGPAARLHAWSSCAGPFAFCRHDCATRTHATQPHSSSPAFGAERDCRHRRDENQLPGHHAAGGRLQFAATEALGCLLTRDKPAVEASVDIE